MIAATMANGEPSSKMRRASRTLSILQNFLTPGGGRPRRRKHDTIKVNGVEKLHGGTYTIIPDQIEAGTYYDGGCRSRGRSQINNIIPEHLECISAKRWRWGSTSKTGRRRDYPARRSLVRTNVKTLPYPDFQPICSPDQCGALPLPGDERSSRKAFGTTAYKYVNELKKMGAVIEVSGKTALRGVSELTARRSHLVICARVPPW
jgi:UDP-N-acetylglucosamine 1-carboxyvinyltransferase